MFDLIKKSMLTGLGLALKTRDEVEELAKDWANRQKMNEEEGLKFIDELLNRYDSSTEKLENKIQDIVKDVLKKTNIASREDLEDLKEEVAQLKQALKPGTDE